MNNDFFSSKPQQISKSAFDIAKKIFGDLALIKLIVVGENKLSNSILQYLHHNGVNRYIVLKEQKEKKLFLKNIKDFLKEYDPNFRNIIMKEIEKRKTNDFLGNDNRNQFLNAIRDSMNEFLISKEEDPIIFNAVFKTFVIKKG